MGGLATAAALILTYVLLRITRQEQRDAQAEQRRAQARQVSAWADQVEQAGRNGLYTVTVKLQNLSDEPIYAVRGAVGARWSGTEADYEETEIIYIMPPKSAREQEVSLHLDLAPGGSHERTPPVEVIFYDATHRELWLRNRFGTLTELADNGSQSPAVHFFKKPAN